MSLRTNIDEKFFSHKVNIEKVITDDDHYIYQIFNEKNLYIVKGHKFEIEKWIPAENNHELFSNLLNDIGKVYQDYFLCKLGSRINKHIPKSLEIAQKVIPELDKLYLYIEVLFEYNGEILCNMEKIPIDSIYNIMKQSLGGLSLLHSAGIPNLNIRIDNMFYDKINESFKFGDIGRSFGQCNQSDVEKTLDVIDKSIGDIMEEYAPPEVLKYSKGMLPSEFPFILESIDIYNWAICFYSIILGKSKEVLKNEAETYKLNDEKQYEGFIALLKENLTKIEISDKSKKDIVIDVIVGSLNYDPRKRFKLDEIIKKMGDSLKEDEKNNVQQKESSEAEEMYEKVNDLTKKLNKSIEEMQLVGSFY